MMDKEAVEIETEKVCREALEAAHGRAWNTAELTEEFNVIAFLAPYVEVRRKSDGAHGSMLFTHRPRFYYAFEEYKP